MWANKLWQAVVGFFRDVFGPEEQLLARCWGAKYCKAVLTALRAAHGVSQGAQTAGPMGQDWRFIVPPGRGTSDDSR